MGNITKTNIYTKARWLITARGAHGPVRPECADPPALVPSPPDDYDEVATPLPVPWGQPIASSFWLPVPVILAGLKEPAVSQQIEL